ncbi:MAG: hypothetical protein E3J72_20260 [Planctomycetota bacterium]|nr:MAG: hypothetical protein E3J72_20260 [Planctomycetota bacterium]
MRFTLIFMIIAALICAYSFSYAGEDDVDKPDPVAGEGDADSPDESEAEEGEEDAEEEELSEEEEFMRKMREMLKKQMEDERKRQAEAELPGQEKKEDPIVTLLKETVAKMKEAEQYLAKHNPDKPCKVRIDKVNENLDKLIDLAQQVIQMEGQGQPQDQQQQKGKPKSGEGQKKKQAKRKGTQNKKPGGQPQGGRRERNDQRGSTYQTNQDKRKRNKATLERLRRIARDAEAMRGGEWGHLPPKIREDALDAQAEDYPEKYRDLIEEYYRRLSGKKDR